ncbi:hypothetical protein KQH40_00460 [bacterium]|nr:hypothetical protein [bacterium]
MAETIVLENKKFKTGEFTIDLPGIAYYFETLERHYHIFVVVDHEEIEMTLLPLMEDQDPSNVCQHIYKVNTRIQGDFEPVAPYEIVQERVFACIYQFVDGGRVGDVFYHLFFKVDKSVWKLTMSASIDKWEQVREIFEQIGRSVKIIE